MVAPVSEETIRQIDEFMSLYADWLEARASYKRPRRSASDGLLDRLDDERDAATRSLMTMPVSRGWMIWHKLEVFGLTISESNDIGQYHLREAVWMWGCIKADMMRFGFRNEEER